MRGGRRDGGGALRWLLVCALVGACGADPNPSAPLAPGALAPAGSAAPGTSASCTPGAPCASRTGPCVSAAITCQSGSALCTDVGPAPDGTPCGAGQVCAGGACVAAQQASGGACSNPIATSAAPATDGVQHLGAVRVGSTVAIDVPANTASITIVEQAISAPATVRLGGSTTDNTAIPLRITTGGGTVVFDDTIAYSSKTAAEIASLPAFFDAAAPGTGTITIPNTTGGLALVGPSGLPSGKWSVLVSDYAYECTLPAYASACSGASAASTYDVTVITKSGTGGAAQSQASVDVAIYFATTSAGSGAPLLAATAGNDPDLTRMAQTLRTYLGKGGVSVSSITYRDLPTAVQALYATGVNVDETGTCSELSSLLRQSGPGNLLNVFFVSSFASAFSRTAAQVVGIDGTIPGPATFGGTGASGAAVATHDLRAGSGTRACTGTSPNLACGADVTAYIIAHEAGHFLGLYHVTENDGAHFDPLQDTPMCPCSTCAPVGSQSSCATDTSSVASPYQMQVSDCTQSTACGGGSNLMFWALDQGSVGTLTTEQQRVIGASPLVH